MTGKIILSLLTASTGAFFGSVSSTPGIITGAISGFIVAWFFIEKMYSIRDTEPHYYRKGMLYGTLAGLVSGSVSHLPTVILNAAGIMKIKTIFMGSTILIVGVVFGIIVGFLYSFFVSAMVKKLP